MTRGGLQTSVERSNQKQFRTAVVGHSCPDISALVIAADENDSLNNWRLAYDIACNDEQPTELMLYFSES